MPAARTEKTNRSCRISKEKKQCPYCPRQIGVNGYIQHVASCERKAGDVELEEALQKELMHQRIAKLRNGESSIKSSSLVN